MKILFDARVIGKQMHGIGRYALNLLQRLIAGDRENEYLVLTGHPEVRDLISPQRPVRFLKTGIPLYGLREQLLIPFLLRREAFDLYHSPTYTIPLIYAARGILTIHDLIHLLFPRDYGPGHRLFYRFIVRPALSRCRRIFTVSECSKNDIIKLLGGEGKKMVVTPNGLDSLWGPRQPPDPAFIRRYGLEPGYLVFVGNPRPHKNFSRVLEAFELLVKDDLYPGKLAAIGVAPRPLPKEIKDRVIFLPRSNDRELINFYSGADLLAAPSLYEGFGLPVLEAMACGCPVLIGNQGALPEIAGKAGLMVDPYQVQAILQGMKKVLFDADLRRKMREKGLKQAAGYTWEKTAGIVMENYASLARVIRTPN
jgi:glycosyltransferase involved in cell wall biosynthesis